MRTLKRASFAAAVTVVATLLIAGHCFAQVARDEKKLVKLVTVTGWVVIQTGWKLKGDKTDGKTFQCSDLTVVASYDGPEGQTVNVKGGVGFTPIANRCHFTVKSLPPERAVRLQVLKPDWLKKNCDQSSFVTQPLALKTDKKDMLNVELIVKEIACQKVK